VEQVVMQPVMAESDEALAQRALADRDAFAELVRRYADRIFNLAYRMTGDRAEAEDLAQEAFLHAYRGLASFKPDRAFGAWVYRIAVNICLTHRRRRASAIVEPLSEHGAALLDTSEPANAVAERRETQAAVQQAILSLPPMYRAVIILYHLEERPYSEIAELLDLPINTVRTHLHRGRAMLREKLAVRGVQ
jgi:RNA polymerase sigma-70 factor (ECF subfamily)